MELTKEQKKHLTNIFKQADNARLLFGPEDKEALFLHGKMSGMRETLESAGLECEGITGLWWYENLGEAKRQESIGELTEKHGRDGKMLFVLKGRDEGVKETLRIINKNF